MFSYTYSKPVRALLGQGRPFAIRRQRSKMPLASHLAVPILPATLAQLDLLLGQTVPDLAEVSRSILTDMGATLHVFRCARICGVVEGWRASRISDCVVQLGKTRLQKQLRTVFSAVASRHDNSAKELLERARLTAEMSRFLAKEVSCVSPERAYLAGLVYEVGRTPVALGWHCDLSDRCDPSNMGRAMIKEWGLPAFLEPTLPSGPHGLRSASPLVKIVDAAWKIVNERCQQCGDANLTPNCGARGEMFRV